MEAIRKQIHLALLNVSRLCEEFSRKYPQYYPPPAIPYEGYSPLQYGGFPPIPNSFSAPHSNNWVPPNSQFTGVQTNINSQFKKEKDSKYKDEKVSKPNKLQDDFMKKNTKEIKKQQKKLEQLKRQSEKQRMRLQSLKNKKKIKNTLKNQIKKDPRFAEKPKFPTSPYFLFLKEMRTKNQQSASSLQTSKQFAEQMGKAWRQMSEQVKMPYITAYLKQKRIYDEKTKQFYQKYPDLKPKGSSKKQEHMYSVNDPKYQSQTVAEQEQELQADLIDELNSQQDGYDQEKFKALVQEINQPQDYSRKHKDSLTLSDQKLTSQAPIKNNSSQVVEID